MSSKTLGSLTGFKLASVGVVVVVLALFLPWFANPNMSGSGLTLAAAGVRPSFVYAIPVLALVAGLVSLVLMRSSQVSQISLTAVVRVLLGLFALILLGGMYHAMKGSDFANPLEVTALFGTWIVALGCAAIVVGGIMDYAAARAQRWTTVDLVLLAVCAALYGAALLSLSFIKLTPGTWLRPGNALQAPFGILFGLPGALGIGLGNVIADLNQGMAPHVMVLGFTVNFLGAFIPYLMVSNAALRTRRSVIEWVIWAVIIPGVLTGASIWINVALGLTPKFIAVAFGPVVFLNQAVASGILGPPLLKLLYPFVVRAGLYRGREVAMPKSEPE